MKVTVCEMSDNEDDFIADWHQLTAYLDQQKTDLLLLPEMPFGKWIATEKNVSNEIKAEAMKKHEDWTIRLEHLNAKYILYSKPVIAGDKFFNTAFVYEKGSGHFKIHTKSFFPEEPFFWEESWFDPEEEKKFEVLEISGIKIGVLLCTEMWFMEYARQYGKQGIDLLLCPRATGIASANQWMRCGQTLAILSGAYCLSSNRSGPGDNNFRWGGTGWIMEPATGDMLGITTQQEKFFSIGIDLEKSRKAKHEYPLYVKGY
ncbi:MAG TPA: carbon-nitrogen hydrolase family protein [Chitinophagaceae bacterium]